MIESIKRREARGQGKGVSPRFHAFFFQMPRLSSEITRPPLLQEQNPESSCHSSGGVEAIWSDLDFPEF